MKTRTIPRGTPRSRTRPKWQGPALPLAAVIAACSPAVAFAQDGEAGLGAPAKGDQKPVAVMDQVYAALKNTVAGTSSNQIFVMEAPGRVLDESTYIFDTSTIYATLEKPQPVLEAEFRLSDGLLDPEQIVGGPNGKLMSVQYSEALNLLVPNVVNLSQFYKDRQTIREWLLEEVKAVIDGEEVPLSRMELFQRLNSTYEDAKSAWVTEKTARLVAAESADNPTVALEAYAKWLANEAAVEEGRLDGLFADLVVRGYYHEVRTYLSVMDVSSVAELLEQTKSNMRNSSMSSLDETETIYPVEFQPTDWFKALSTDFKPQDLLMQPDFLQGQAVSLAQKLDSLEAQKALLLAGETGDADALQKEVDAAQQKYDDAQSAMIKNFSNAVIAAAQIAFQIEAGGAGGKSVDELAKGVDQPTADKLNENSKQSGQDGPLTKEQWQQIADFQSKTIQAQQDLNSSSRALASLQAAHAAAMSTDAKSALILVNSQIQQTQAQLDHLKVVLASSGSPNTALVPDSMPPVGVWTTVTADFSSSLKDNKSDLSQSSSHTSWDVDLIFGSASGSKDSQSSSFSQSMQSSASDLQIGFRATKVTIDRGGWFNPGVIGQSSAMFKTEEGYKISPGLPPDMSDRSAYKKFLKKASTSVLPAYPVAFVIAKDVTIKFKLDQSSMQQASEYMQENSSVGGGFLCFSASSASSSTHRSQSYYFESSGEDVTIKIPGPQILGWVMEFVPEDGSKPYPTTGIPAGTLPKDVAAVQASSAVGAPEVLANKRQGGPDVPYPFTLRGAKVNDLWSQVTNNQWANMLPQGWVDKGFHFYSRVRSRGPADGINTPSDLESEIRKGTVYPDPTPGAPNRYRIELQILNSAGTPLKVFYDYAGGKGKCELVTLSF